MNDALAHPRGGLLAISRVARSTPPADLVRVSCGLLLALHFGDHFCHSPGLIGVDGIYDSSAPPFSWLSECATRLRDLGSVGLRVWFGSATALSLAIALGIAPRISSGVLFLMSVLCYYALFPVTLLDDHFARYLALGLALLPAAADDAHSTRELASQPYPPTLAIGQLLALGFYLSLGLGTATSGEAPLLTLAYGVTGAALIVATPSFILAGAFGLLPTLVHLHEQSGAVLAPGALASLYAAYGLRALHSTRPDAGRVDIAAALAFITSVTFVVQSAAGHLGSDPVAQATARLSAHVGLHPPAWTVPPRQAPLQLAVAAEDSARLSPVGPEPSSRRSRILLGWLASSPHATYDGPVRLQAARRIVGRHCRHDGEQTSGKLLAPRLEGPPTPVAWFRCEGDGPPRVVLLGATTPEDSTARASGEAR